MPDNGKSDEIKILLGSDVCWEIQTGKNKRVHKNLFAIFSIFGWSLVGSFGENHHSASMFTVGASHCLTEENVSIEDNSKNMGLKENENQDDK